MTLQTFVLAAVLALASLGGAQADGLHPRNGQSIDLGDVSGTAYYTAERSGFHVVATLAQGETGTPIRFEAVLTPGQSVVFSSPRGSGLPADAVEISRENDTMLVRKAATN